MATKPTREQQNRAKDEARGIRPGGVNLNNPPNLHRVEEKEPVPDITELDLISPVRKRIAVLVARHYDLGKAIREAEAERKQDTEALKAELATHLAEVPSFFCEGNKVTRYLQTRKSISEDLLRVAMLNAGVPARKIDLIISESMKISSVETLRVTSAEEVEP